MGRSGIIDINDDVWKNCLIKEKKHNQKYYFFLIFVYLFIYFWLHWVFVAAHGLSLVAASGGYSSLWCMGFSLRWLLLLWSTGSRCMGFSSCGLWALECRLSSCGARALLLPGMWDPPRPGLEPVSPAVAGGFLTSAPPGKTRNIISCLVQAMPHSPASYIQGCVWFVHSWIATAECTSWGPAGRKKQHC